MAPNTSKWLIPSDLQARVDADEDLMWTTDEWDPIQLTVMGGTSYCGRDIALAWEIELDPSDSQLEAANLKLVSMDLEPDGYGWCTVIESVVRKYHPEIMGEFHVDSEMSACVVWVESEEACRRLVEVVWALIHADDAKDV